MMEIADEPLKDNVEAARARNRIDVCKFAVARLAPKKYGDRVSHDVRGDTTFNVPPAVLIKVESSALTDINAETTSFKVHALGQSRRRCRSGHRAQQPECDQRFRNPSHRISFLSVPPLPLGVKTLWGRRWFQRNLTRPTNPRFFVNARALSEHNIVTRNVIGLPPEFDVACGEEDNHPGSNRHGSRKTF